MRPARIHDLDVGLAAAAQDIEPVPAREYEADYLFAGVDVAIVGDMSDVLMATVDVGFADVSDLMFGHNT